MNLREALGDISGIDFERTYEEVCSLTFWERMKDYWAFSTSTLSRPFGRVYNPAQALQDNYALHTEVDEI